MVLRRPQCPYVGAPGSVPVSASQGKKTMNRCTFVSACVVFAALNGCTGPASSGAAIRADASPGASADCAESLGSALGETATTPLAEIRRNRNSTNPAGVSSCASVAFWRGFSAAEACQDGAISDRNGLSSHPTTHPSTARPRALQCVLRAHSRPLPYATPKSVHGGSGATRTPA